MDIVTLKDQIIKNQLRHVYIFTGSELEIQRIYLQQISKVTSMPIIRAEKVVDIYSQCTTKSFLGNSNNIYVIRNDTDIAKHEEMYQTLEKSIKKNIIVLLYEKLDSRLKFGKFFKDVTVPFEKLTPPIFAKYVEKESGLSPESIAELSNKVSGSYDLALLEIDKIKNYSKVKQVDTDTAFKSLLAQGVIYQPEEADVFQFTDAVCSNRVKDAVKLLDVLQSNNISAINILGTLYNSMKSVLLIQCCEGSDVCNITGLDNRQVYFNKKYVRIYDTGMLVYAVKLIARVIEGIKTGWIEEKYAVRYVLVNIM